MEYGKIMSRSANIVWQNKFLIILGFLAALGSPLNSGGGGGGGGNGGNGGATGQFPEFGDGFAALAAGVIIALVCLFILVALVLWAISTIARGGLIASVDTIDSGQKSGFRQGWSAGWHKGWTLLGIGILPAIPGMIMFVIGLLALGAYGGIFALLGEGLTPTAGWAGLGAIVVVLLCIVAPIVLVLSILRNFAERACMLEDLGVIDSYSRGWRVLTGNLGEAIILFILQILLFLVLWILFFLPGLALRLCFCLWPLLMVIQGAISAFVSGLWTLAWRQWTGEPPLVEKAPTTA